jgi:hypothetical protein
VLVRQTARPGEGTPVNENAGCGFWFDLLVKVKVDLLSECFMLNPPAPEFVRNALFGVHGVTESSKLRVAIPKYAIINPLSP